MVAVIRSLRVVLLCSAYLLVAREVASCSAGGRTPRLHLRQETGTVPTIMARTGRQVQLHISLRGGTATERAELFGPYMDDEVLLGVFYLERKNACPDRIHIEIG